MKQLIEHINKQFKENNKTPFNLIPNSISETIETEKFGFKNIKPFIGKKVIVQIQEEIYRGVLSSYKNGFALLNEETMIKAFNMDQIKKITSMDKKLVLNEVIKKKEDGYYVESEKGKNLGGPYSKEGAEKRLKQVEYFKRVNEDTDLLLRERLKNKFFNISEEVVNKDHKGRMTKGMQASRDKIASKLKNVKVVKGPPGRDDTPEEAKYRLATYLEWKKKGGSN